MDIKEDCTKPAYLKPGLQERLPKSSVVSDGSVVMGEVVFNSWRWDLRSYAKVKAHRSNYDLNFLTRFGEERCFGPMSRVVISAMEYCYVRLKNPVETDNALNPATLKNNLNDFKHLFEWMDGCAIYSFQELDRADLNRLVEWLRIQCVNGDISVDSASSVVGLLLKYYEYRKRLSDPLTFNPFGGRRASELGFLDGSKNDGNANKTPPIPKDVMDPLLRYSLDMVTHFSDDILCARDCIFNARKEVLSNITSKDEALSNNVITNRIRKLAVARLKTLPISDDPRTGRPWRVPWESYSDWLKSEKGLMSACMTIVFFLSGMRECEVVSLEAGCAYKDISSDGVIEEYFVRSRLLKRNDTQEVWVVIKPAYDALLLAEKISRPFREANECDSLFPMIGGGIHSYGGPFGYKEISNASNESDSGLVNYELGQGAANRHLNSYVEYLNNIFGGADDVIPKVDNKKWNITTRQFRRTLARYIARQPFGVIAGMIQYKHAKTSTFEGYANNDLDWNQMLEEEKTLASIDHLKDLYLDIENGTVAGAKGEQLVAEYEKVFNDFKGAAGDKRSDDLSYWLDNKRANFHVGNLNYCFFNPDYALCIKNSETEQRDRPVQNRCHPDKCSNSCVSKEHAPIWQLQYGDADELLQGGNLSEPQRVSLEYDRDVAKKILKKIAIGSV